MGRPRKYAPDPAAQEQLRSILSTLARSGASQWFVTIRRRRPGLDSLWQYWKRNILAEQIDDVAEYCYKEGGEEWEYRVRVHDTNGEPPVVDGKPANEFVIPATKNAAVPPVSSVPANLDPIMAERKKRLDEQKFELEIERQEAELAKSRRRLDKIKSGEEEEDDDDGYIYPPPYPYPGMYPGMHPGMNPGMGYGFNSYMNPMMNQMNRPPQADPGMTAMAEAFKALAGALAPQRQQDSNVELLKVIGPLIVPLIATRGKDMDPKDWIGMMSPMITELGKSSAEANKIVMSSLAEMDSSFRERLLDLIMADPNKSEDEINRLKGYLGMGMDVLERGTKLVLGRSTITKGGDGSVKVPVIEKPKAPGLPGPKGKEPAKNPPSESGPTPAEEAKKVIGQRVNAYLVAHEQELLIGSEPAWVVEKLEELWASFPETLRFKLEHSDVAAIYETLREYDAPTVDRILEAVKKDESDAMKKWAERYWEEVKLPPEDDDSEDGENEEEPEPEEPPDAEEPEPVPKEAGK